MRPDRVLKFGGAALGNGPAVERVCDIIARRGADRSVVVVSAHAGVTDLLETLGRDAARGPVQTEVVRIRHRTLLAQLGLPSEFLDPHLRQLGQLLDGVRRRACLLPSELDAVLSFGERMSARIVARTLRERGVDATPVDAYDLGFVTDSNHGRARPLEGIGRAIRQALAEIQGVAVVTGFLAKDRDGNLTTLGRNGSDLTASVLAESVGAQEIEFWKNVDGILSADPEIVPDARLVERLSYGEAAECAFHGARILHPASVAPVLRAKVAVRVRNVARPDSPGTSLVPRIRRRAPVVVASKRDVVRVDLHIEAPERRSQRIAELFARLDEAGLCAGMISAAGERASAVVDPGPGLPAFLGTWGDEVRVVGGLASLALVGEGLGGDHGAGLRTLELLQGAGIEVEQAFLGQHESSQAFVVQASDLDRAVRLVHDSIPDPSRAH